jgi:hypothetical protein
VLVVLPGPVTSAVVMASSSSALWQQMRSQALLRSVPAIPTCLLAGCGCSCRLTRTWLRSAPGFATTAMAGLLVTWAGPSTGPSWSHASATANCWTGACCCCCCWVPAAAGCLLQCTGVAGVLRRMHARCGA